MSIIPAMSVDLAAQFYSIGGIPGVSDAIDFLRGEREPPDGIDRETFRLHCLSIVQAGIDQSRTLRQVSESDQERNAPASGDSHFELT
jgi:hypothetical protein